MQKIKVSEDRPLVLGHRCSVTEDGQLRAGPKHRRESSPLQVPISAKRASLKQQSWI